MTMSERFERRVTEVVGRLKALGLNMRLKLTVTAPGAAESAYLLLPEGTSANTNPTGRVDALLTADDAVFARLLSGTVRLRDVIAAREFEYAGDLSLLAPIEQAFGASTARPRSP